MRKEKKFLVNEAFGWMAGSDYVLLAAFNRLTVADVAVLRKRLREKGAMYHVVKNSVLRLAARERGLPDFAADALRGATAIVTGDGDPSNVAKVLQEFMDDKEREDRLKLKCGVLDGRLMSAENLASLAKLPSLAELRARFLALLQAPAQNFLMTCDAALQGLLRVLSAYATKGQTG
ncbi:MAG: 50S ribosomal protein L10 [Puniceicoccales bacterium]|jgi:large subunit ribosomal protein L10|nr:50S ribosomal protein L10 [Puniceicoccales bacterium]